MSRDQRSAEAEAYRPWYKTARWRQLRSAILRSKPLCRMCREHGVITAATVVDHIQPHKGDEALFWSPENLQPLCATHHNRDKQSEERRGYSTEVGADGWPTDQKHPFHRNR